MGLPESDLRTLRRAGLVQGFGRLGISNAIWDKPGPLGAGEWERVRMHPYITERMLRQSTALAPLGAIAMQHRERLDGSGYPGGTVGSAISLHVRILGAADAYQAMREPRPHRRAHASDEAAKTLRIEARAGRLPSVENVLSEAFRVLRPGGELRALEHVRSEPAFAGFLMDVSNPLWLKLNRQGCCWNRNPLGDIEAAGFRVDDVVAFKRFDTVMPAFPMRRVRAHKPA
jgi:hypothetical protein